MAESGRIVFPTSCWIIQARTSSGEIPAQPARQTQASFAAWQGSSGSLQNSQQQELRHSLRGNGGQVTGSITNCTVRTLWNRGSLIIYSLRHLFFLRAAGCDVRLFCFQSCEFPKCCGHTAEISSYFAGKTGKGIILCAPPRLIECQEMFIPLP